MSESTVSEYPKVLVWRKENGSTQLIEFNPERVIYSDLVDHKAGSKVITALYPAPEGHPIPVVLSPPAMFTIAWLAVNSGKKLKKGRGYSIGFSFDQLEQTPDLVAFKNVLEKWDQLILNELKRNMSKWFNINNPDLITFLYRPMVKQGKFKEGSSGERWSDSLWTKVRAKKEEPCLAIYPPDSDSPKHFNEWGSLQFGYLEPLLVHSGIWFTGAVLSSTFETPQIRVNRWPKEKNDDDDSAVDKKRAWDPSNGCALPKRQKTSNTDASAPVDLS